MHVFWVRCVENAKQQLNNEPIEDTMGTVIGLAGISRSLLSSLLYGLMITFECCFQWSVDSSSGLHHSVIG